MKTKSTLFGIFLLIVLLLGFDGCKKFEMQPRYIKFQIMQAVDNQYGASWESIKKARAQDPPIGCDSITNHEFKIMKASYESNALDELDRLSAKVRHVYYDEKPWNRRDKKWDIELAFDVTKPGIPPDLFALYPEFWKEYMKKCRAFICDVVKGNIDSDDKGRRNDILHLLDQTYPYDWSDATWGGNLKARVRKLYTLNKRYDPVKDGFWNTGWLN